MTQAQIQALIDAYAAPLAHKTRHYFAGADPLVSADIVGSFAINDSTSQTYVGLSVTGRNGIIMDSNTVGVTTTIQNLSNGVAGQLIALYKMTGVASTTLTIKNGNTTGGQAIYLHGGADISITSFASGVLLMCTGNDWREMRR